jgi:P pilus assembly chaperone PapD
MTSQAAHAALALDRTRAILDGGEKSLSMSVTNQNRELPFLAQAWVEDGQGKKLTDPLWHYHRYSVLSQAAKRR